MSMGGLLHTARFFVLVAAVVCAFCFADFVPYEVRSYSYAISLSIKEVVIFLLPFVVFSIVLQSTLKLQKSGTMRIVLLMLILILVSNSASILVADLSSRTSTFHANKVVLSVGSNNITGLIAAYTFKLPRLVSNINAAFIGFLLGTILSKIPGSRFNYIKVSEKLARTSFFVLEKVFVPILPVFIVGLVFKMQSDDVYSVLKGSMGSALHLLYAVIAHLCLLYFIGSGFKIKRAISKIKDMIPSSLVAFTTMSSFMSMPLILKAVKKDSENPNVFDISVPVSLNVHLVGDCFFMIVMSLLISDAFHGTGSVSVIDHFHFLIHFLFLQFAIVAVPGGGIMVMLPIMEQYLRFSPTMASLITTLYVISDPFITVVNVLGNGAFAMLFSRTCLKLLPRTNDKQ